MILRKPVIKRCDKCNGYLGEEGETVYGCDSCKKEMKESMEVTVFYAGIDSDNYQLCSWECVLKFIQKVKKKHKKNGKIHFIALPYLTINDGAYSKFFKEIKKFGKKKTS